MELTEFFDNVNADPNLEGVDIQLGETPFGDRILVRRKDDPLAYSLCVGTILEHDWETLQEVILGDRETQLIYHVTRIVGYFSRVENWNLSKIGELRDRREGDYEIGEEAE